ncbi:Fic family protein [Pendulispora rubella]|uniref:Fic family protein n=1 Tax=Pendulispora rubella TaxID=2741070 RepID=A0ABZ2L048_9BACT
MVTVPWPALQFEERTWSWAEHGSRPSRREDRTFRSYASAIPPEIAPLRPALSSEAMTLVVEAERRCATLDGHARHAGPELNELAAFLLRSESVASSKIERVEAPARAVFEVLAGLRGGQTMAGQVAANIRAMQRAVEVGAQSTAFGMDPFLSIHRELLRDDAAEHAWAGRLRMQQNWIGGSDDSPRGALFVPPRPERVEGLLHDLFRFAERLDIPPIVQAAIAHAQLETIHPFTDGNGRVGRALIHVILRRRAVITRSLVPVSTVLLSEPEDYFSGLTRYREGDLDTWVSDFARAVIVSARHGDILADRILELRAAWLEVARPRKKSAAAAILEGLIRQPVVSIDTARQIVRDDTGRAVADKNVYEAIERLVDAGILVEITRQRRNRAWVANDVLDLLERFQREVSKQRRLPDSLR